ncbi:MAG: polysaccharide pyruvyl transferase family protein [Phycisphaerae bacterium]
MSEHLSIFVADVAPLANKGEEAILRGIEDMLRRGESDVRMAALGPEAQPTRYGNITVYPSRWVYPVMGRGFGPGRTMASLAWQCLKQRLGLSGRLGNLAGGGGRRCAEMQEFFNEADYVIVGHDGVFGPESCGAIHVARKLGKRVGILGAGVKRYRRLRKFIVPLYRRAVEESDFAVFRERTAYGFMESIGCDAGKIRLAPDPAFAMVPAPAEEARALLGRWDWYGKARKQGRLLIAATVCQKGILLKRAFAGTDSPDEKRRRHAEYLAEVFDGVIARCSPFVVFLPHSIEEGDRNDLKTAQDVVAKMGAGPDSYHVIEDDLPARTFKAIIRECDFLIGQRAHSLIGSASLARPYVALTASNDTRTHDILGHMCGCEEQMIDMDARSPEEACREVVQAIDRREAIGRHLEQRMADFRERLAEVAALVRGEGKRAED